MALLTRGDTRNVTVGRWLTPEREASTCVLDHRARPDDTSGGSRTPSPSRPTCRSPSSWTVAPGLGRLEVTSVGAHPGVSSTNLTRTGAGMSANPFAGVAMHQLTRVISQSAEAGAWPLLMAA